MELKQTTAPSAQVLCKGALSLSRHHIFVIICCHRRYHMTALASTLAQTLASPLTLLKEEGKRRAEGLAEAVLYES